MKPPYRHPKNNVWFTEALFYERVADKAIEQRLEWDPPFSLFSDIPKCINARRTFIALMDPTGYKWSMEYLGDYEHWKRLMKCKWFQDAYDVWMEEMKMKLRSEALDVIRNISESGQPAQALVAAKYLASFEWEKAGRGRPSQSEINGELKRAARLLDTETEDAVRIGLVK